MSRRAGSTADARFVVKILGAVQAAVLAVSALAGAPARADTYVVTLDPEARDEPATGRVILFFVDDGERRLRRRRPAMGPFWDPPQPIASVAVEGLAPGDSVTIDGSAVSAPGSLDDLDGPMRVQAVLDADLTERSHLQGPGNALSDVVSVELGADRDDTVTLRLTRRVTGPRGFRESENLELFEMRSELLSAFYGRDVYHRAGVALPRGHRDPEPKRANWPAIYVIPGFGGRHGGARTYAQMLGRSGIEEIAPIAVYVVLDPESPLGHHGFVDSPNHGPRGTALVTELIPALEKKYRLVASPEARLVTGHSSGGWTSLWLQLRWPDTFGACWAGAPDPIDFRAFQKSDIYRDASLYVDADGDERPSFRQFSGPEDVMKAVMTVRQEGRMEHAMHPGGASGQQWDTWEAMFSPRDPETGLPVPMFDAISGRIDRSIVDRWSKFDMGRLVREDWERYGPIVMGRVRLNCGELDSFYLDGAVRLFKEAVEARAEASGGWTGPGYVRLVPDATHGNLTSMIFMRLNEEMRKHLMDHGLQDRDPGP